MTSSILGYTIRNKKDPKKMVTNKIWARIGDCKRHITLHKNLYYKTIDDWIILPFIITEEISMIDFIGSNKVMEALKK